MRTTINIDDDILKIIKSISQSRELSIGRIVSELIRKAIKMEIDLSVTTKNDLPVFQVKKGSHPITLEDVKKIENDL